METVTVYFTAAAQHPPNRVKFDFYYMHCLNCSVFFPALMSADWISHRVKVRLLEMQVWTALAMYASRRAPELLYDEIANYKPLKAAKEGKSDAGSSYDSWDSIFARVNALEDDGHASKLVRAVACAEKVCAPYAGKPGFKLAKEDWLKIGNMAIDSVEGSGTNWVRSAGFEEAWESVEKRANL